MFGEEERAEMMIEEREQEVCEAMRAEAEGGRVLEEEEEEVLERFGTPWLQRIMNVCIKFMDTTTLFHCEAAMDLAAALLARPAPPPTTRNPQVG